MHKKATIANHKVTALLLSLVLAIGLMPLPAFAAESGDLAAGSIDLQEDEAPLDLSKCFFCDIDDIPYTGSEVKNGNKLFLLDENFNDVSTSLYTLQVKSDNDFPCYVKDYNFVCMTEKDTYTVTAIPAEGENVIGSCSTSFRVADTIRAAVEYEFYDDNGNKMTRIEVNTVEGVNRLPNYKVYGSVKENGSWVPIEIPADKYSLFITPYQGGNTTTMYQYAVEDFSHPATNNSIGAYEIRIRFHDGYSGTINKGLFVNNIDTLPEGAKPLHTVNFVENGGTKVYPQHVEEGSTVTKPTDPSKAGYVFGGWYADEDFTTPYDFSQPVTGAQKIYVKYVEKSAGDPDVQRTVTYDANGGAGSMAPLTANDGATVTLSKNAFSRQGYLFKGWATAPDGDVAYVDGYTFNLDRDLSLYAVWEKIGTDVMLRLYNPNSGEHFYTANAGERDSLVRAGWRFEGNAWTAPKVSNTPVYRLYNPNAGDHHYTTNAGERDSLTRVGWKYEGVGWYSDDAHGTALLRLYNPNAKAGSHHYTAITGERDQLVRVGWKYEGIGWYGVA